MKKLPLYLFVILVLVFSAAFVIDVYDVYKGAKLKRSPDPSAMVVAAVGQESALAEENSEGLKTQNGMLRVQLIQAIKSLDEKSAELGSNRSELAALRQELESVKSECSSADKSRAEATKSELEAILNSGE